MSQIEPIAPLGNSVPASERKPIEVIDAFLIVSGVLGFFFVVWILAFHNIPDKNMQLFTVAVSFITGAWLGVAIGNRLGTSKGSETKSDVINAIASMAASTVLPDSTTTTTTKTVP